MYCLIFQEDRNPANCKYCSVICNQRPIEYIITTTTDSSETTWLETENQNEGALIGETNNRISDNKNNIIIKASRLAESILMDWDKEEQIALAKEVASLTHKEIFKEE